MTAERTGSRRGAAGMKACGRGRFLPGPITLSGRGAGKVADTNISYIVIGNEIKGPEEKEMVDICTRVGEQGVSDKVLLAIKEVQAKLAKEVETILKENSLAEAGAGAEG